MSFTKPTSVLLTSIFLLVAKPWIILQVNGGVLCKELETPTLSSLYEVLSLPVRTSLLCPFTIEGDGCDKNTPFIIDSSFNGRQKNIECDVNNRIGGQCRINCNIDTHFVVKDQRELILDSMVLEGAKMGSVRVARGSILRSFSTIWRK